MKRGILRTLDHLGRIVIPVEYRNALGIGNEKLEIFLESDSIILKKHKECCVFCNSEDDLSEYKNKSVCKKCMKELKSV